MIEDSKVDTSDYEILEGELENCFKRIKEENEASKKQLADLNIIHAIAQNLRSQLEILADYQIVQNIDEIDEISILLSASESVLKGIKQASIQRELRSGKQELIAQSKQLNHCVKILSRDERHYQEEKREKEDLVNNLKTKTVLMESEMGSHREGAEKLKYFMDIKDIKSLHEKSSELDKQIAAEEAYLKEFHCIPASFSEAAIKIEELKEEIKELDADMKRKLLE